ncbi:Phosphoribosyl pyrophosphate synthase-associated protein 2 [Holothuria leucospilota]|uniref:Phosphoribosyl pyrophosphate synthase-associated protein 2 n=1 Tax=Holothuria leucospilota TaxID=206669 RepID=A0A9Q1C3N2_HOLLE|nr:Phosphoribosyl pyrophosphate synthase-associated protein 2 [Holothuria leucospilota]
MAKSGMNFQTKGMILFAGNSHRELAQSVADKLGIELGKADIYIQDNRETAVDIKESVRGKDVFILAAGSNADMFFSILSVTGITNMITMDLHHKEIQGFYNIPVDNLRASPFLVQYIKENIPDWRNAVIVARNPGAAKRATSYSDRLRLGLAVIHGEQKETEEENIDGRHSPPPVVVRKATSAIEVLPFFTQKEKPPINVDDIIDDAEAFIAAGDVLKERGAYKVYIILTHGILSGDAPKLLEQSSIDEIVVTNTLPQDVQRLQCNKIRTVDISLLLAESIRRIHNGESMSYLFRNIPLDD